MGWRVGKGFGVGVGVALGVVLDGRVEYYFLVGGGVAGVGL